MTARQESLQVRLLDAYERASHGKMVLTGFFSAASRQQGIPKCFPPCQLSWYGGYEQADRQMACVHGLGEEPVFDLVVLKTSAVTHPQLLGALLHAGIDRKVLGDILTYQDATYLVCKAGIADYLSGQTLRVNGQSLSFQYASLPKEARLLFDWVNINVSSYRLDAVVAALGKTSRAKANEWLKAGWVKINDVVIEHSKIICDNDFVSIRKVGRFQLDSCVTNTRKGRLVLRFKQMR